MPPGLVKAGRYEIIEELGRGSMGVVYRARDPLIGRTVAVKTLLTDRLSSAQFEEYRARFRREAQATGILTHPNIVTVYDFGEDHGFLYITMEFLQGKSLEKALRDEEALPVEKVISIYEQVTSALDYAHQHRIVHRDIKPANLMLLDSGTVKVADFGIAKIMSLGMTADGQVLGTPNYMSPEQITGKQLDGRSDIFSLGVILYEMLTGEKPFSGRNLTTITYKIVRQEPIPPRELDATIHPGLSYVITKALAKNPADRYQSCRALLEDLKNYKSIGSAGSATVVLASHSVEAARPAQAPTVVSVPASDARPGVRPGPTAEPPKLASVPGATAPAGRPEARLPAAVPAHPAPPVAQPPARPVSQKAAVPVPQAPSAPPKPAAGRVASIPGIWWGAAAAVLVALVAIGGFLMFHRAAPGGGRPAQPAQAAASSVAPPPPAGETAQSVTPNAPAQPSEPPETTPVATPTAGLRVTTDPAGAQVIVDRVLKGKSPLEAKLSPGEHTLTLKLDGMRPYSKSLKLRAGVTRKFEATLVPEGEQAAKTGRAKHAKEAEESEFVADALVKVQVRTIPNGATLRVDGAGFGTTPRTFSAAPGRHTLTISKPGYQTIQIGADWPKGQAVQTIDRTLVPE